MQFTLFLGKVQIGSDILFICSFLAVPFIYCNLAATIIKLYPTHEKESNYIVYGSRIWAYHIMQYPVCF